ncbi:restriction endonuclease subunit S [Streptomyces sp. NPDC015184]|uniref:restriction endonuclease subunit S n=1 Tax=Streptomyces sp. NPDC015184 TaxID=3364946 RepID=UPI0036FD0A35
MGKLPEGWVWVRLGDLGEWFGGGTPSKKEPDYWEGGDVPWLSPKDMKSERLADVQDRITERAVNESSVRMVPRNSVAIVTRSGILEHSVPVASVPFATTLNQDMKAVVTYSGVLPDWIAWALRRYERKILGECRKAGTTVASLSTPALMDMRVPVPPFSEQQRVVEALEEHLSRLDAAEAQLSSVIRRSAGLEKKWLDIIAVGRSVRRSGTADLDSLEESKTGRFDEGNLIELPHGWKWRRASAVCQQIVSGSTPKAHLMSPGSGDVPFLKVYNISQRGFVDFSVDPTFVGVETHEGLLKRSRVLPGDVLTNIVGPPLGKTAMVPDMHPEWNINQAIVSFRAGPDLTPRWLTLVLSSPYILGMLKRTSKATAGQFNIAVSTCRDLPIPCPPIDEQEKLIEAAEQWFTLSENVRGAVANSRIRATGLRMALLRRAFVGDLVPQDPADEPAATLLARIAAEREAAKPVRKGTKRAARPRKATAAAAATKAAPAPTPAPATSVQQELFNQ